MRETKDQKQNYDKSSYCLINIIMHFLIDSKLFMNFKILIIAFKNKTLEYN